MAQLKLQPEHEEEERRAWEREQAHLNHRIEQEQSLMEQERELNMRCYDLTPERRRLRSIIRQREYNERAQAAREATDEKYRHKREAWRKVGRVYHRRTPQFHPKGDRLDCEQGGAGGGESLSKGGEVSKEAQAATSEGAWRVYGEQHASWSVDVARAVLGPAMTVHPLLGKLEDKS